MSDKKKTEFYMGAIWAASVLLRTTGDKRGAVEILHFIPDVKKYAAESQESDVHELRLYIDRDLPIGKNPGYKNIRAAFVNELDAVVTCAEQDLHHLETPPGVSGSFCVVSDGEGGCPVILLTGLTEPTVAIEYAEVLRSQVNLLCNH